MSFALPTFLVAAAAVAIPLIVHLLSRWQVRQMELGTMRFLQEVVQDGAQRRRIRRWLLLLTRSLLVLLLALLFARPYLTEAARRDGNRLRIILIDRSASMGMQGREGRLLDDAVSAGVSSAAELGSDATILWAWFDRSVEPLPEDTTRPTPPRAAVGDTNYAVALRWARDRLNAYPDAAADVVLVTDLQQSGMQTGVFENETLSFPRDVPVQIVEVSRPAANNLAITNAVPSRKRLKARESVRVNATLFNYGTLPFEGIPFEAIAANGPRNIRQKKTIDISSGEAAEVSFDFGKLDAGTWQIRVALDVEDDLTVDNQRFTAVEVADPIRILVIDSGSVEDGETAESYFLATALQQDNAEEAVRDDLTEQERLERRGRFRVDRIFMEEDTIQLLDVRQHPLVVVARAGAATDGLLQRLENYVREGGELLVFAGNGTSQVADLWQHSTLAPGTFETPRRSGVMPFRISSIDAGSRMMKPFSDPQHADLSRLAFRKIMPIVARTETTVLASFDERQPAITENAVGQGRVVWFLSSADPSWSNWPTSPLYLPIVQQMAADLLNLTGEGLIRYRNVGDACDEDVQQMPTVSRTSTPSSYVLTSTDASPDPAAKSTLGVSFTTLGFVGAREALYVVNSVAKESDPSRMEPSALTRHFDLTPANATDDAVPEQVTGEKRNELWPWLAAAVLVLVIAEFNLSNRTTA